MGMRLHDAKHNDRRDDTWSWSYIEYTRILHDKAILVELQKGLHRQSTVQATAFSGREGQTPYICLQSVSMMSLILRPAKTLITRCRAKDSNRGCTDTRTTCRRLRSPVSRSGQQDTGQVDFPACKSRIPRACGMSRVTVERRSFEGLITRS